MSYMGYAVVKTGTPELWLDDGYAQYNGSALVPVCGLTQVASIAQSGTGVITVTMVRPVNVIAVHPSVVSAAGADVDVQLVSVTVNSKNVPVIVLQAVTLSTGAAVGLTSGQGLCLEIKYSDSILLVGQSPKAGMVAL